MTKKVACAPGVLALICFLIPRVAGVGPSFKVTHWLVAALEQNNIY